MRLPISWLHAYCRPNLDVPALAERLAMTGTEVDRVHHHGVDATDNFVVGYVTSREQHPDADRLSVCLVDIGDPGGEPSQIVCGAPNVDKGQYVAVAKPGSIMPDGTKLKKAKLRGVVSNGMICAEDELGLGSEHDGILVLGTDDHHPGPQGGPLVPGMALTEVLPIADDVLELEITPNRPDCLSVYGVAREVHAATGAELAPPPWAEDPGLPGDAVPGIDVTVEDPELCPRFTARGFENVTIGPSPTWLKQRLLAAGQRPISNVVDITNYVMLETGQPLHAFDMDRIAGGALVVRRARDGERVTTLDDVERTLDADMVLIADADGPTSIAGVMGGARSEVGDTTTRVLMEAANWIGHNIQRTSSRLGLRSEASSRFEKQLSPGATMEAQALAAKLMIEVCGATLLPGTIDIGGADGGASVPPPIRLRAEKVESLLGAPVAVERQAEILEALGFDTVPAPDGLDVVVPHFRRHDVTREADLIEEVARINGFESLPATLPSRRGASGRLTVEQRLRRRAQDALLGAGVNEIVGWSFVAPDLADRLRLAPDDERRRAVTLRNPMSSEQSLLRTTLLGSLLDAARHNTARGQASVRLWELGPIYIGAAHETVIAAAEAVIDGRGASQLPTEHEMLAGLLTGPALPGSWRTKAAGEVDVFAARGLLETVLGALRIPFTAAVADAVDPFLHPARAARVLLADGTDIGWFGEIHPTVAAGWDLEGRVAAFEIDLGRAYAAAPATITYADLTSFPSVKQDIAVVVADDVPAARVVEVVRKAGGPTLAAADVFDVYTGAQVGEGRRSLALRLEFRAPDRTLTDEDVAKRREKITKALGDQVGGELRG